MENHNGDPEDIWTHTTQLRAEDTEEYKQQKAYLVALASCIREIEPGSLRHQDRIRKCRKLIEETEL